MVLSHTGNEALAGRVIAITGGARGIGKALAEALVRENALVAIGDLDAELAAQVAKELGGRAIGLPLNVAEPACFTGFLDEVERRLGPLDVLVNNAGIMPVGPFEDEDPGTTDRLVQINLRAYMHGCQQAVRRMKPRGRGHIVNVASVLGLTGTPGTATYCATKFGVVGLSQALGYELAGTGVEISVVMPGLVRTELSAGIRSARGLRSVSPEQVAEGIVRTLRKPRFAVHVPREIAPLTALSGLLPFRGRRRVGLLLGLDRAYHADMAARARYEARANREAG